MTHFMATLNRACRYACMYMKYVNDVIHVHVLSHLCQIICLPMENFLLLFRHVQYWLYTACSSSYSETLNDRESYKCNFEWTDCIMDRILKKVEVGKFITTALKSILKLVKLQSLVAKCCKMRKI